MTLPALLAAALTAVGAAAQQPAERAAVKFYERQTLSMQHNGQEQRQTTGGGSPRVVLRHEQYHRVCRPDCCCGAGSHRCSQNTPGQAIRSKLRPRLLGIQPAPQQRGQQAALQPAAPAQRGTGPMRIRGHQEPSRPWGLPRRVSWRGWNPGSRESAAGRRAPGPSRPA